MRAFPKGQREEAAQAVRPNREKKEGKRPFVREDRNGPLRGDMFKKPRFRGYTALNAPRERVLEEAL